MQGSFWYKSFISDEGLAVRIGVGVCLFAALAAWDIHRKGRSAQRWREYVFLAMAVAAAMAFGAINDQITCTISPEYFQGHDEEIGKALAGRLDDQWAVRWEALKLGLKATWTAGLIIGVAFLFANNPHKTLRQLPYRRLATMMLWPLGTAVALAGLLGAAGLAGWLVWIIGVPELSAVPWGGRMMCVWGWHLGAYAGGAIGLVAAVWRIRRLRKGMMAK
jgi:hypothetical protein